jgi:hypothetical protein
MSGRAGYVLRWCGAWLGALALAGAARALLQCQPDMPALPSALAAALALGFLGLWLALWCGLALGLGLGAGDGRKAALQGSWAWCLALAWPLARRAQLPYPHDLPERPLQILLAAALLMGLASSLLGLLRGVLRHGSLAQLSPRAAALRLGGLVWVVYLASSLWTWRWLMTGDAPAYVLMSATLSGQHNLDLGPYYKSGEWRRYYPLERDLPPLALTLPNGQQISEHRPLLSALAAPAYRVGGFAGVIWTETLLGALATGLFYLLLRKRGMAPRPALLGWALLAFGAPWWIYSQSILVEVLAGALGLAWLCAWEGVLPEPAAWILPALLPWVGTRLVAPAAGAALAWAWHWRRRPVKAAAVGAFLALSLGLVSWFNASTVGSASVNAYLVNNGATMQVLFNPWRSPQIVSGLLLDQEYGLLPWAPVLLLAVAGASLWWRRRDSAWMPVLGWSLPYCAVLACFVFWTGPMAPARYLIALVPFLALAAVEGMEALRPARWPWVLSALSWALALVMQVLPWFCFSKGQGASWPLRILGSALGLRLTSYFPSFIINAPQSYLWSLGLVLFAVWMARRPALAGRRP